MIDRVSPGERTRVIRPLEPSLVWFGQYARGRHAGHLYVAPLVLCGVEEIDPRSPANLTGPSAGAFDPEPALLWGREPWWDPEYRRQPFRAGPNLEASCAPWTASTEWGQVQFFVVTTELIGGQAVLSMPVNPKGVPIEVGKGDTIRPLFRMDWPYLSHLTIEEWEAEMALELLGEAE